VKRIVIIGAGITGLTAAYCLAQRQRQSSEPFEFVLLEAGSRAGGVVHTEPHDGFLLERGPDSFISEKPAAIDLVKRLGIESGLIETNNINRRSFIVRKGRLEPVPEGFHLLAPARLWPFLTSNIFSLSGKIRMSMDLLLPRRLTNGADESLASFVTRRLGREALERMAQPMVGGIYTGDPNKLSLRATLPRMLELEQSDRSLILGMRRRAKNQAGTSGARYTLFLSFDKGMQVLTDTLIQKLPTSTLRLNSPVTGLSFDSSTKHWSIKLENGEALSADAVCLALPSYVAASLIDHTNHDLASELRSITYESTATVNLAFARNQISHALNGFGFVVPIIERRSLLACSFSSVKFSGRAPDDCVLLRAFVGGALQPEMFALDDEVMMSRVVSDLRELLGITGEPRFATVTRWRKSMPQYHLDHLKLVDRINNEVAKIPRLVLAGNAYSGVGIPDCISSGETAAERLTKLLDGKG
jgi:protoporphyrinogen/coproporphyrinogen III oxidase